MVLQQAGIMLFIVVGATAAFCVGIISFLWNLLDQLEQATRAQHAEQAQRQAELPHAQQAQRALQVQRAQHAQRAQGLQGPHGLMRMQPGPRGCLGTTATISSLSHICRGRVQMHWQ